MNRIVFGGIAAVALAAGSLAMAGTASADKTCTKTVGTGTISIECTTTGVNNGSYSFQYTPATGINKHWDLNGSNWDVVDNEHVRSNTGNIAGWRMEWEFVRDKDAHTFDGRFEVYSVEAKVHSGPDGFDASFTTHANNDDDAYHPVNPNPGDE